jgi:hypothetical protein
LLFLAHKLAQTGEQSFDFGRVIDAELPQR